MFRATVQLPMLAGLEICVLTSRQMARMEAAVCKKLRALLRGAAARKTNLSVRQCCGICTVQSILRRKRLLFARSIWWLADNREETDSDLPTLLWGVGHAHVSPQLNAAGQVMEHANPWIKQYVQDVQAAVHAGILHDVPCDPRKWLQHPEFRRTQFKHILCYVIFGETTRMMSEALPATQVVCGTCLRLFADERALRTHCTL
jgi:hypothetical protein